MGLLDRLERGPSASITGDLWRRILSSGGSKSAAGIRVSAESAMRISAVFACVRAISEDIGKIPLILYQRAGRTKKRAIDHPCYHLMHDEPNEWQTAFEWREMSSGHLELRGNAFSFIVRARDEVREVIPINPDIVTVRQDERYRLSYKVQKIEREFRSSEILHLRGLSHNGFSGISTIGAAREAVGLAAAMERHGARLFANGAKASGVATHPGVLSDPASERLKHSIEAAISDENVHRILLLEEGMKWDQLSMTSEDSQFIESRKLQIAEIARFWRMPLHKIGDLDRSTNNNIEHQALEYVTDSLLPRLRRIEQRLNRSLLTERERKEFYFEFLVDFLLRGDTKTRYEAYDRAIRAGWMNPNEARERENLEPVEGLDEYRRESNTEPVGSSRGGDDER